MILKSIITIGLYALLIMGIAEYVEVIKVIFEIPSTNNLGHALVLSWLQYFLIISAIVIGIVGSYIIQKIMNINTKY